MRFIGADFMNEIQLCIYEKLLNANKLTSDLYSKLINEYGEENVNYVIDKMIDLESENSNKFDYYIVQKDDKELYIFKNDRLTKLIDIPNNGDFDYFYFIDNNLEIAN